MGDVSQIFGSFSFEKLLSLAASIIPALICISFHELSHGITAYFLGDRTAKNMGRLSLNPVKHIDPWGLLCMIFLKFGWAKPVPVNMRNFKNPKLYMAITAIAGPLSNILLASITFLIYGLCFPSLVKMGESGVFYIQLFQTMAYMNCAFAVFNMLPIPPLDGSRILTAFFPDKIYYQAMRYERYSMIFMMVLLVSGLLDKFLSFCAFGLFDFLIKIAQWSVTLV